MLQAKVIDHINMTVKDLDESVAFYRGLFGFTVLKKQPEKNSKIIGNDAIKLCLYQGDGAGDRTGIAHFGFNVTNFDDVIEQCESRGVKVLYGGVLEWKESRSVYIEDPNGYEIELSEVIGGGL